jgi:hypothetical protein
MSGVLMLMLVGMAVVDLDGDQVQHPKSHPTLRLDAVGQGAHRTSFTLQHQVFESVVVIEGHECRGNDEIVVSVPPLRQPVRKRSDILIIDKREVGYAGFSPAALIAPIFDRPPDEIANGLRSARIALRFDHLVERGSKTLIDGDRGSLH